MSDTPTIYRKKLNPEAKAKWVAALRSGKYQQGKNKLRNFNNEFCCVGVAEDVLCPSWSPDYVSNNDNMYSMSSTLAKILGVSGSAVLIVEIDGKTASLYGHNDEFNHTFEQIANAIETQL